MTFINIYQVIKPLHMNACDFFGQVPNYKMCFIKWCDSSVCCCRNCCHELKISLKLFSSTLWPNLWLNFFNYSWRQFTCNSWRANGRYCRQLECTCTLITRAWCDSIITTWVPEDLLDKTGKYSILCLSTVCWMHDSVRLTTMDDC